MDGGDDLFYPLIPEGMAELPDAALLEYIERADNEFGYQAQLHYALKLDRQLSHDELQEWLAPGLRIISAMHQVIAEVYNGGFAQYFTNSGANAVSLAVDGFREIGAAQLAEIVVDAATLVFADGLPEDSEQRWEILEAWDYDELNRALEVIDRRLDEAASDKEEELRHLMATYIRENQSLFFRANPQLPDQFGWMQGKGY